MSKAVVPSSIVFEVLDGHNYVDWSEAIEAYLKAQDLWDVVESDQQPPKKQFKAIWEKKNAAALHAIKISCGANTLPHIRGIREANEAWSRLEERFSNPPSSSNSSRNFFRLKVIERSIADVENVDYGYQNAYGYFNDALSKRNFSAAIELCEENPLLLTKTLPNIQLVLNELINLGGRDHQNQNRVVAILNRVVPSDDLRDCLYQRDMFNTTPLDVAVRVGAILIARCLAQMVPELLFDFGALRLNPLAAATVSDMKDDNAMAKMLYSLTPQHFWTDDNGTRTATVITTCLEAENFDFALKLLRSHKEEFILSKDIFGNFPLCAAARAPHLFRRTYHHPFFPKYICEG